MPLSQDAQSSIRKSWPYTQGNHLRWGKIKSDFGPHAETLFTKIGPCKRKPNRAIDEAIAAAREISEVFGPNLVLCMSSGVDSECMARAFLEAKVPFKTTVARFFAGGELMNHHDSGYAIGFSQRQGLECDVIDIDLVEFYESGTHLEYARKFQCRSPQLAVHLRIMDIVHEKGGIPILAGNTTEVEIDKKTMRPALLLPTEPHLCYMRFLSSQKRPGVPFFFQYTPELIYSFWQTEQFAKDLDRIDARVEKKWLKLARMRINSIIHRRKETPYLYKVLKYQEGGFAVRARARKATGFELAKGFFRDYYQKKGMLNETIKIEPFDYFLRRPLVEMNPYPRSYGRLFSAENFPRPDLFQKWFKKTDGQKSLLD